MSAIRLLLVDDHRLVAETLAVLLRSDPAFEVVGLAASGPEALALTRRLQPSVVLMDIGLPGMDGVEATWALRRQFPAIPVLVLTMFHQEPYVLEALRAGASGYLLKTAPAAQLVEAVRRVASGQRVIDPAIAPAAVQRAAAPRIASRGPFPLSRREIEVVQQVVAGHSVRDIARELHLSAHTVRNHLKSAYRKLGVHSQAEVAVHALRRGIACA
ncbi:MAG: response regulator transcription factor [Armatimonadota bacterium]|nr:response regulator transcription factor [Armatimonadota bacterium]MDR7452728.1 response regulator transcription factor [Armatimonadota bacterium]MDR7467623.1 response regulator transcription factor [Armatimonadota bacterium]MDR7494416.1 response regulator transcription factor [Armatimonadota bacterium]MDR7500439.1 response regulator transcription factor [Armatimonadota bacterium]